tara:strand:+ start:1000 stop:1674 length:675 start_codon:yes stop_codon:yes gene_type:complete
MEFKLSYIPPNGGDTVRRSITDVTIVGRDPGNDGVVLSPEDMTISAKALELSVKENGLLVSNSSSYSNINVEHNRGVTRHLHPGEELLVDSSITVIVEGEVFTHKIEVEISGTLENVSSSGTTIDLRQHIVIAEERKPALICLCAARFYPERYGTALLPASNISQILKRQGIETTPKAINNKVQRTKNDVSKRTGLHLDTREDLADFLIENQLITRSDVDDLLH